MKEVKQRIALICLMIAANSSHAALEEWGATSSTSLADCPSFCTNFTFGPSLGGPGITTTGISEITGFRGHARASASLTGELSSPLLKAEAFANPNSHGAFATAFAVQAYTYAGPGETIVIDVMLDGLVNDPENDSSDTSAYMEVVLYRPENFLFISDRGTLELEAGAMPYLQPDLSPAAVSLRLDHLNPIADSGQISVDASNGDEFYLWSFLRADATAGLSATSADAFNTGTISFSGDPALIATAPVPIPATIWLFGGALLGLTRYLAARN